MSTTLRDWLNRLVFGNEDDLCWQLESIDEPNAQFVVSKHRMCETGQIADVMVIGASAFGGYFMKVWMKNTAYLFADEHSIFALARFFESQLKGPKDFDFEKIPSGGDLVVMYSATGHPSVGDLLNANADY